MLRTKHFVSCLQAAQNTVVFNEKPSRESWDTFCTSVCSVSFANLKCNFAKNPLLSGRLVAVTAATVAGKITRGLTKPCWRCCGCKPERSFSFPTRQRTSISFTFHRIFSKFQRNALHSFVVSHFKALKVLSGILLHCCPM